MAWAAFLPLRRGTIRLNVTRELKEERKEQHSLSGPPYPDHLPGHTDDGDCGQIRIERIRKLIRRVDGTMGEQPASPAKHVGDSTFRTPDRLVSIDQEETIKALGSNTRFAWSPLSFFWDEPSYLIVPSCSIDNSAKVDDWRSNSDLPLPDFLTVLPRPWSVPTSDKENDAGHSEELFGSVRQSQSISTQMQGRVRLKLVVFS